MPIFEYRAFDLKGATKRGTIDADTARDARERLRRMDLRVTEIDQLESATRRDKAPSQWKLARKVGLRELAIITRQLATLLRSGVHLSEGFKVLIEQVEQRRTEVILRDVREKIVSGMAMAEALSFHPSHFSDLYINMVRAGEASGNLDEVLNRLADYLQAQASLKGKVVTALTYPAVMVVIGIAVVIFLMSYVVPKITETLLDRDQVLPKPTQVLIAISEFFQNYWWAALLAVLAAMVSIRIFASTEKGRLTVDTLMLKLPVVGGVFKKQAISRFTVTLSTLLKSGLPALESLNIVAAVVNNALLTQVIGQVAERIIEGADISTPLRRSKIFPPMVAYMVAVGEQSGQLEEILDRISEAYEEEVDLAIQRMTALAEPIIIVCLAVVVGFIILAVLLPLLQISQLRG
ncbi:MAG: type II secretion system inner membrane protein GspF [Planctomycetota bacterium]